MNKKDYYKIIGSSFICIGLMIISLFISNSFATFIFSFFIFFVGHIYCIISKTGSTGNLLFNRVFAALLFFALLHYIDTVLDYPIFAQSWRDEYKFWISSDELGGLNSIMEVFKESYSFWRFNDLPGYAFYIGSIAYLANTFSDGNHLLLQFMGSAFWASMMAIVLLRLFLLYFDKKSAHQYALYFSLLTVIFAYSFMFLRDIIIAFFYTLSFFIIAKKFSIKGLVCLGLSAFLVWQIRFQHGLFLVLFILAYLYANYKRNKVLVFILVISGTAVSVIIFNTYIQQSLFSLSRYDARGEEHAMAIEDSLGKTLFSLPTPIKEISFFLTSQIRPFPSWHKFVNSTNNMASGIVNLLPIIYGLFWFVVSYSLFKWSLFKNKIRQLPHEIKILFFLSVVFLFIVVQGASDLRRIMCVYPVLYLTFLIMKNKNVSTYSWKRTRNEGIFLYLLLTGVYLVIKYF